MRHFTFPMLGARLSKREVEILTLIAKGARDADMAEVLGLSLVTVKMHAGHICRKLSARTRAQAVVRGVQWGYLDIRGL